MSLRLVNVKKYFLKNFFKVLTDLIINSFKQKSINMFSCALVGDKGHLPCIVNQYDITISLMTMETTTNTGKNQKFNRKVREESVEAI